MTRYKILAAIFLIMTASAVSSQEVIITGFPTGVAGSIPSEFFQPYHAQLKAMADTLNSNPFAQAIIIGGADGIRYRSSNDAKNPALALGRAHVLRNYMMTEFHVDSAQIVIRTKDVPMKGPEHRFASISISWELAVFEARLDTVASRPPIERHFTEITEITNEIDENSGLLLSAGLSSSPFGVVPMVASALTWKRLVYVEIMAGHTFWNGDFTFESVRLDTKRRFVGGHITIFPDKNIPVGLVGGWVRYEEIAKDFQDYVKMSEGPIFGLRAFPGKLVSVLAAYNPSRHRIAGDPRAVAKNDQFMLSVTIYTLFGGGE